LEDLPANQKLMGGLRIAFTGKDSDVMITGGLVNQTEGYSALIPFYPHDAGASTRGPMTLASTGIMVGQPDPRMGFPDGTAFFPYAYLRNASSSPMKVDRAIFYTLAGGGGQRVSLPGLTLGPGYAAQVSLDLGSVGLGGYSGEITETFSATINPGDLIVATGSTDQTANYVFEVLPQAVATTRSKQDCFWMVGRGWDTMSTLWNSGSAPEDLIVTIGFNGGDGHYKLPVHLEPGAGKVIDLAEVIRAAKPDADGHLIPRNVEGGGMIISGSSGLPEKINVVVSGGVFSVFGATCFPRCVTCGPPPTVLALTPASLSVPVGGSQQMTSTIQYSNGQSFSDTNTTWTSKNTSVATVSSSGMMNAVAAGSTDINGQDDFPRSDRICSWPGLTSVQL
jgi:Bacterial Ig-like domain (group 2)